MSKRRIVKKSPQIQTILVGGSKAKCYERILQREPTSARQELFLEDLLEALDENIPNFKVPIYDPSINKADKTVNFVPGAEPAMGYSYKELKKIARKNNLKLGSKNQYVLFVATMILRLIDKEVFSEDDAWEEMCDNSQPRVYDHITGSYCVAGKYDLGQTLKVLEQEENSEKRWIAGTDRFGPVSTIESCSDICIEKFPEYSSRVGWFVLEENDERTLNNRKKIKEFAVNSDIIKNNSHIPSKKYETISVLCSRSVKYERLLTFDTTFEPYKDFQELLKYVMGIDIPAFKVPVYFPTLNEKGLLQFIKMPGLPEYKKPLVGLSYNQCKKLAKKSGVRLGTRNQYILFIATLILKLIDSGKSDEEAWNIMYNYLNNADDRLFECIRGNHYKILANDVKDDSYYLCAGGRFFENGSANTIWFMSLYYKPDRSSNSSIGWFVF